MSEAGVIKTTEGVVLAEGKATTTTFSLSSAFKGLASSLGITTTALGVMTGALAAVAIGAIAYKKWAEYQEDLRQSAVDASNALTEQSKSVDNYVERYQELQTALKNAKGDEQAVYSIKQDLLVLQNELNDAFGEEYGKLNLVTDAYKDQTEAIKQYNKELAQSYLNENESAISTAKSKMESDNHYNLTYTGEILNSDRGAILKEIAESYKDKGVSILDELGDGTYTQFSIHLNANAEDAQDVINDFMNDVREKAIELNDEDLFADVLEISSSSLNQSKNIIDEYGDIYKKALLSEIATNDGLSTGYNQITQAVESYNEAILKSEDPYNDDNVKNAWNNLQSIKQGIEENVDVWGKYESVTTEAFKQANDSAYSFYQTLQNDDNISKLTDDLKGLSNTDLQSMANDGVQDSFDKLCQSANDYGLEIQDVIDLLVKLGIIQGQIARDFSTSNETRIPLGISETIDALNTKLKPTMDSLKSAYQDIFTEDGFTLDNVGTDMLQSIKETIDELNDTEGLNLGIDYSEFEEFARVLSDTSSTEEQVHEQFDKLASSIVEATGSAEISAENFTVLSKALTEMGLVNADTVLTNIKIAQDELIAQGYDLTDITEEQARAFIEEGEASAITVEYLRMYMIQKQLAEQPINTSGDIEALESLCDSLGVTGELMENIIRLKSLLKTSETMGDNWQFSSQINAEIESYRAKIEELASGKGGSFEFNFDTPNDNKKKSSSDKDNSKEFDWIERAIDNIEKQISRLNKISDSAYSSASEKNKALADQIHLVNQEIALQQKAYEGYMEKANSVGLSDDYKNLVQAGAINIEKISDKELQEKISAYQEYYDKAQETQDKINDLYEQSNDYHVSAYELHLEKLNRLRDNQSISEREYLNRKQQLYIKYYNDNVKLAEVAHEAKLELLNEEKEYLQSVANSAIDILGEQIDDLKEKQDEEVKAIEAKKKPLEDQLELLEEAKDKEDRILALQRAQYELKRAQSQRDKLTYVDGQMVYRNDDKAVRDAQKAVDDAEYDIVVGNIQDQIDAYDRQIDKVNERYETEIAKIQKVQNEWEKVITLEERSISRVNFESMFGNDGISKLLSGDMSQIEQWKNQFAGVLKDIDLTNDGVIGAVAKEFSTLANVDLSNATSQTQAVIDQYETLKTSVSDATSAIGATSSEQTEGQTNTENAESKEESSTLIGAMEESYSVAEGTLPAEAEMFDNIASSVQGATNAVYEYKSAIESLGNSSVSGVATIGNAYADGTRHAEKGLAIVAEEKPEAIQTNDGKVLLAEKPTLLNMEGGETVYNGDETKKMLKGDLKILERADSPLLRAFNSYTPDDIMNRFGGVSIPNYSSGISSAVANSKIVNNNNKPTLTINGGINVTCPAVTSKEVMNQVSTALQREFSGMALDAYQRANITR